MNAIHRDVGRRSACARLWIPTLAAYTGAKIVELAALRREDCLHDDAGWSIRLNGWERLPDRVFWLHDAASRTLPLHRAVIAQGFPAFVESCPPGLLFAEDDASVARAAKTAMAGAKVGAREVRRRFVQAMRGARVDSSVKLAILGRPEPYDKFGLRVPLDEMREAIDRLPEFDS